MLSGGGEDKRREERIRVTLPVDLGTADGLTSDVSASGMFLETGMSLTEGDTIDFAVEFDIPGGSRVLRCRGKIVRTEMRGNRLGVAVKILDSRMESGLPRRETGVARRY